MADIGWHFQGAVPGWAGGLVNARFNKVMFGKPEDIGANPFPGLKTIGRAYMPDGDSNALVMEGEAGAVKWFNFQRPFIERAPWIEAWEGPNEPPVQTADQRRMLTVFTRHWADLMHGLGKKVVALNLSCGWPDVGKAVELAGVLAKADYIGLHEYAAPTMYESRTWLCLRYRRTVAEWKTAGYRVPPIFIGELGIDGGTHGEPKMGWQHYCSAEEYTRQLMWYAQETAQDGLVCGTAVFTSAPVGDWYTFEVTEQLSKLIHDANFQLALMALPVPTPVPSPVQPASLPVLPVVHYPIPGAVTTQYFGEDKSDYSKFGLIHHNGWDFSAKVGTPVMAPISGQAWTYFDAGYGNVVEIWFPRIDASALYKIIVAHGSKFLVANRVMVEACTPVMLSGNTGNSTGPHLHFGFKWLRNGAKNPGYRDWVDPRPYMEAI